MKGIILAGGKGSRLYPMSTVITKQLQPVYDKPMIYYPLSVLMLMGIREILLIVAERDKEIFHRLLGNGSHLGIDIEYVIQYEPRGLAEAFLLGEDFIKESDVCLILGDNFFYGDFQSILNVRQNHENRQDGNHAHIFAYKVMNPSEYGIVDFDRKTMKAQSVEEKPQKPKSSCAILGMYFFDTTVADRAKGVRPSKRGELEITSILNDYLAQDMLGVELLGRGITWFDMGTPESFQNAGSFVCSVEKKQQYKISCIEEVALNMEYIDKEEFLSLSENIPPSDYQNYLLRIYDEFNRQ